MILPGCKKKIQMRGLARCPSLRQLARVVFAAETVDLVLEALHADEALLVDFVDVGIRHAGLDAGGVALQLVLERGQARGVEAGVADLLVGPLVEEVEGASGVLARAPAALRRAEEDAAPDFRELGRREVDRERPPARGVVDADGAAPGEAAVGAPRDGVELPLGLRGGQLLVEVVPGEGDVDDLVVVREVRLVPDARPGRRV